MASQPMRASSGATGSLTMPMLVRLKCKAKHWKEISHDHALDQSMAMGFRCHSASKHAAEHWSQDGHKEEEHKGVDLQTNTEAITNLLNNCLGSGILAVAFGISQSGIIAGLLMLAISCVMNRFSLLLLVDACTIADIPLSYSSIAKTALGNVGKYAVIFVFFMMGYLCLVSYVDATVDATEGIFSFCQVEISKPVLFLIATALNFPATFIRSLKSVAVLSSIAFVGALIVVLCAIVECGGGIIKNGIPPGVEITPPNYLVLVGQINIFAVTFCIQAGGSIVMGTLQDPSRANQGKVTAVGFSISFVINVLVGVLAYLRFTDSIKGDVVKAFDNSPWTLICKIALLDLVVLSYMFMMIPCRTALLSFFFNKNEAKMESSYTQFCGMTLAINCAAICVAYFVPDVGVVMKINGSISSNLVAWILPAAIYISMRSSKKAEQLGQHVPVGSPKNLPYFFMIAFGVISMVTGLLGVFGVMPGSLQDVAVAASKQAMKITI